MFSYQKKVYGRNHKRTIIVFSGWGNKQWQMALLGQYLASSDYRTIVYTYHPSILSPDVTKTRSRFMEIKNDALRTIKELPKKERKDIAIFGISQGTIPAFMVANDSPAVTKIIASTAGADLAEIVWSWDKEKKGFKEELMKQNYTLEKLRDEWFDLSPINNHDRFIQKKILLYAAKHDEVIPFEQTEKLINSWKANDVEYQMVINEKHRHFLSSVINLLRYDTYQQFLSN